MDGSRHATDASATAPERALFADGAAVSWRASSTGTIAGNEPAESTNFILTVYRGLLRPSVQYERLSMTLIFPVTMA